MATITASLFAALDGVVDPGIGNWHFPYFNEEMGKAVGGTHDADVMLFGRVTYEGGRAGADGDPTTGWAERRRCPGAGSPGSPSGSVPSTERWTSTARPAAPLR